MTVLESAADDGITTPEQIEAARRQTAEALARIELIDDLPVPRPCVPKGQEIPFRAAVRTALREHYVARGFPLDFGHGHVEQLADSVLANWSMAIMGRSES